MKRQPTTQQITWFLDLERNGQLDLNPPYQRRSVWSPKDRKFFLDTIFRNYPTPPIFVHRTIDDTGKPTYHIVDGKQRLETILSFAKNKLAIDNNFGDLQLNGRKFNELELDYKKIFWDYILVVDFIESIEGTNIEEVFDRVNRNSINLQPQELRHAKFNGWFINVVEKESEKDFWWDFKVSTRAKDKRMKNIQFIAELFAINLDGFIVGFDQVYLDEIFAKYESPEETIDSFNEDEFWESTNRVKTYLNSMSEVNPLIFDFAKTANNLYSLWAFIALNRDLTVEYKLITDKYVTFMQNVTILNDGFYEELQSANENRPDLELEIKYYLNSKGASTDLTQRKNRFDALNTAIYTK